MLPHTKLVGGLLGHTVQHTRQSQALICTFFSKAICTQIDECTFWVYNTTDFNCKILTNKTGEEKDASTQGFVSGPHPKNCHPLSGKVQLYSLNISIVTLYHKVCVTTSSVNSQQTFCFMSPKQVLLLPNVW